MRCSAYLRQPYFPQCPVIYAIVNSNNSKVYIGSASNLQGRLGCHRYDLSTKTHHSIYLQRAFWKRPTDFYVEVVEELPNATRSILVGREQFWMDFHKSYNRKMGYNLSPTAHSCLGYKHREESRIKMSKSRKGKKPTLEARRNMSVAQKIAKAKRLPFTPEQRKAWSESRKGHACSEEEKKNKREWAKNNTTSRFRSVVQFTSDGVRVSTFKSASEAGREVSTLGQNIIQACSELRRSARGFMWRFEKDVPSGDISPVRAPNMKGGTWFGRRVVWTKVVCEHCESEFEVPQHRLREARFCNAKCRNVFAGKKAGAKRAEYWKRLKCPLT